MVPPMIEPRRAGLLSTLALIAVCLACVFAATAATAGATVHYTKESLAEYEHQLAGGEIASATINKFVRSIRVTLKNGNYVLATYPAHEEPTVYAHLTAKGVHVTVLNPTVAKSEAKKAPVKHKLRYIAAGILVVVILIVAGVIIIDRRRKLAAE
jgi:hypothetical protein